ncbi:MAG: cytochrome c3 family protein [Planctomycetes bacterium]|nr:cytochrome c3 family protein [Planctomycetota bacterium]
MLNPLRYANTSITFFAAVLLLAWSLLTAGCTTQKEVATIPSKEAAAAVKTERGITGESLRCISCHEERGVAHGWVADWEGSTHARKGVGCEACHINADTEPAIKEALELAYLSAEVSACEDIRVSRRVVAGNCGKCHLKQYHEFMKSRHSLGWKRMLDCNKSLAPSPNARSVQCEQCHNIQFKCDSCHTRHTFSTLEAKTPDACRTCHSGIDNSQYEIYLSSKHGAVYSASQSYILRDSRSVESMRSPVCVTCHMSKRRGDMLSICNNCHSPHFSKKALETADSLHKSAEDVIKEAFGIIASLGRHGHSLSLTDKTAGASLLGHTLVPNVETVPEIELLFARLVNNATVVWKGAYHSNPAYTHLQGWMKLQMCLSDIKAEAQRMRDDSEIKRKMETKLR